MPERSKEKYTAAAEILQGLRDNEDIDIDWDTDRALADAISIIEDAMPRMADNYIIHHAIHIGDNEIVFGESIKAAEEKLPFLVADAKTFYELGVSEYNNAIAGDGYLEMMRLFLERVEGQIQSIEKEQQKLGIPNERFVADHIVPDSHMGDYSGKLMVVRAEVLRTEYRNAAHQLMRAESGNGCTAKGLGSAVFSTTLATGKHQRFERRDFLGELKPECVPDWAKAALDKLTAKKQAARSKRKSQEER